MKIVTNKGILLMVVIAIFGNLLWIGNVIILNIGIEITNTFIWSLIGANVFLFLLAVTIYFILLKKSKCYYLIDDIYMHVNHKVLNAEKVEERIALSNIKCFEYYKEDPFEWTMITRNETKRHLPIGVFSKKKIAKLVGVPLEKKAKKKWWPPEFLSLIKDDVRAFVICLIGIIITIVSFILHFKFEGNKLGIGLLMTFDMLIMFLQVRFLFLNDDEDDKILNLKGLQKSLIALAYTGGFWVLVFLVMLGVCLSGGGSFDFHVNFLIFPCYLAPSCVIVVPLALLTLEGL